MIILKVIGGLGNQMFQIAFAKMLEFEFDEKIFLDCSTYNKYKIRDFSIQNLEVEKSIRYIEDAKLTLIYKTYMKLSQKIYRAYQKIAKKVMRTDKIGKRTYEILTNIGLYYNFDRVYYNVLKKNNEVKCLYGYFQSEKYFKKYKNQVVEELKVKTALTDSERALLDKIKSGNAIGVSIRLGDDYLNSSSLNVCKEDYYYRGMDYIFNKEKDAVFYIFSDNVDRVKERFDFKYPIHYVEGFKDYESLRLLYSCRHFVISNSSFSWWGAYMSENPQKIIVAPQKWYNDSREQPDIYFDSMVLMGV